MPYGQFTASPSLRLRRFKPFGRFTPCGRFTAAPVYISWFTPCGRFTLRGLHFMVYAARLTFHGLRPLGGLVWVGNLILQINYAM
jgi:hypothetical protein